VISAVLNGDSFILTDPKGEICSDSKMQFLLREAGQEIHILDFRKFDRDGFNCLSYAYDMMKKGKESKAASFIDRFVNMLVESKKAEDDFWNDQAGDLIRFSIQILLEALLQFEGGEEGFHLASVKSFIRQEKDKVKSIMESILEGMPDDLACNPVRGYCEILANPEKTYACIISSANALLSTFCSSESLLRMLSIQTFDIQNMYQKPTALFLVVPDETRTYDMLVGYLIDTFYQILVEEYNEKYQSKREPFCNVHFICDEVASVHINDMASKISASRSRQIDWVLIYQSDKQMQQAYENDWGTICGNCKNVLFLGSSDYEILKGISDQAGATQISEEGRMEPLVSVADLRRMKKERYYKDALLMTGNYIYCAKLPDYDVYPFLKKVKIDLPHVVPARELISYTPEMIFKHYRTGVITFRQTGESASELDEFF